MARRGMQLQMLLSAGYVIGCGYRSVFPVYDIGRQVLVDSWLSSVLMGRSVATVAELCFAAQWALMLRSMAEANDHRIGLSVARLVMPMIIAAEICSWSTCFRSMCRCTGCAGWPNPSNNVFR